MEFTIQPQNFEFMRSLSPQASQNKRQRRRNRHRYASKLAKPVPQKSITISFKFDTTELEAAFAKFRERVSFLPPAMSSAELAKLRNSQVLIPPITRKTQKFTGVDSTYYSQTDCLWTDRKILKCDRGNTLERMK